MKLNQILPRYLIVESYSNMRKNFLSQGINDDLIKQYISTYKSLIDKNIIPANKTKDTNQWSNLKFNTFKRFVDSWKHVPTGKELKKGITPKANETIILHEDDNWLVVIPLTLHASCFHGKETDWCTSKPQESHFSEYIYTQGLNLIYAISKKNEFRFAIMYDPENYSHIEYWDDENTEISAEDFEAETGFDPFDFIEKFRKNHGRDINRDRESLRKQTDPVHLAHNLDKRNTEAEKYILRDPNASLIYAIRFYPKGWPQGEKIISKYSDVSSEYATNVLNNNGKVSDIIIDSISRDIDASVDFFENVDNIKLVPNKILKNMANGITKHDAYDIALTYLEIPGNYYIPEIFLKKFIDDKQLVNYFIYDLKNLYDIPPDKFPPLIKKQLKQPS